MAFPLGRLVVGESLTIVRLEEWTKRPLADAQARRASESCLYGRLSMMRAKHITTCKKSDPAADKDIRDEVVAPAVACDRDGGREGAIRGRRAREP